MLKQKDVITIEVPKYAELSVAKIWPLIKEIDYLLQYFPDYLPKQIPDRDHMFTVLWTLRYSTMEKMINDARKKQSTWKQREWKSVCIYRERVIQRNRWCAFSKE